MTKRRKKTFKKEVQQEFAGSGTFNCDAKLLMRVKEYWKAQNEFYAQKRKWHK